MAYYGKRFQVQDRTRLVYDGIKFDSLREIPHYQKLKALESAGKIKDLRYHTKYTFVVGGIKVGTYEADFTFLDKCMGPIIGDDGFDLAPWVPRVHDVKAWKKNKRSGRLTPIVGPADKLRKQLMLACFGLNVEYV